MSEKITSTDIEITNPAGLHARPAAVFASKAKTFQADLRLVLGEKSANAKSVVGVMGLSTRCGDKVRIEAAGDDAEQAIAELTQLLLDRCGEAEDEAPASGAAAGTPVIQQETENMLAGVAASPGIAIGQVFQYRLHEFDIPEFAENSKADQERFTLALEEAHQQIEQIKQVLPDPAKKAIMSAHQELLQDPDLLAETYAELADHKSAAWSWRTAFSAYSARLEAQENPLLRERATDIRDIGRRVLVILTGGQATPLEVPDQAILIAEDLTPSDTVALDPKKVLGFCTRTGGATSHVAILARSLGIPAICGISQRALNVPDKTQVIIDGSLGTLNIKPTDDEIRTARTEMERIAERRIADSAMAHVKAETKDHVRIEVVANIRNAEDAKDAVQKGAEGVGLLRTEFLFDERDMAPSEQEQSAEYRAVASALGNERVLVVRTLDVGGDKPLSYLPLPKEDNPFLGLRGIRVGLARPDILRTQIRAVLEAESLTKLHIMFPMIASLDELRTAKEILAEEQKKTGHHAIKVGIMIEVPSAAVMAEHFAQEVDFFSIGTNDLTQYVLAMDRGHPELAKQADAFHPAVLSMIEMTCRGAQKHGKWVGVCGGLASEEHAVPLLVGLGVTELSVSTPMIATVKAILSRWNLSECQELAKAVLALGTTAEVRTYLAQNMR